MFGWYFTLTKNFAPGLYRHHMRTAEKRMNAANERAARRWGVTPPTPSKRWTGGTS